LTEETDQEEGAPMRRCQIVQDQEDNTLVKCLETGDTAGFFDDPWSNIFSMEQYFFDQLKIYFSDYFKQSMEQYFLINS
jgi:hypothetical protein